jgi:hypothetical protein
LKQHTVFHKKEDASNNSKKSGSLSNSTFVPILPVDPKGIDLERRTLPALEIVVILWVSRDPQSAEEYLVLPIRDDGFVRKPRCEREHVEAVIARVLPRELSE